MLEEYFNLLQSCITFFKDRGLGFRAKIFKTTYFFVTSCEEKYSFGQVLSAAQNNQNSTSKNSDKYSGESCTCTCHCIVFSFIAHCFIAHGAILFQSHRVQSCSSAEINGCVHSLCSPRCAIDANGAGGSTQS